MLQDIRKSTQGTAAKIIIGLIVISFAAFGIESILVGGGDSSVAEVNGEEISPQELQQAIVTQQRRIASAMGENLDPAMLAEDRLRGPALETLVSRKLLTQSAQNMGLAISEGTIGKLVGSMQQFQLDGEFSPQLYKQILSDNGFTPGYFKRSLRNDLMLTQVRAGLAGSDFATPAELQLTAKITNEQRDFRYLTVPGETFRDDAAVTDEQVEAWYNERQEQYMTEESVDVTLLELSAADFREAVDEATLLEAVEQAQAAYQATTENRVSHILFADGDSERIAAAQRQLADGADFAAVAAEFSDDAGSAGRGGDLGYSSGDAFPEDMEAAIAALQPGEVSAPVETDAGTHLLLLTERREGKAPTLEELRPQLERDLQSEEAQVALLRTVEALRDLSFNADDLDGPAAELDLEPRQVQGVTRQAGEGLFANPVLREVAFSADVLEGGHNSEVIELAGDHFVVLRVAQHHMPQVRPLAQVRESIVAAISEQRAREAVATVANELLTRLRDGAAIDALAAEAGYEWQVELAVQRDNFTVAPDVLGRVFELAPPAADQAVSDFLLTAAGDAVLVELTRVRAGDFDTLPEQDQQRLRQQVSGEFGGLVDVEYRQALRQAAEISVM